MCLFVWDGVRKGWLCLNGQGPLRSEEKRKKKKNSHECIANTGESVRAERGGGGVRAGCYFRLLVVMETAASLHTEHTEKPDKHRRMGRRNIKQYSVCARWLCSTAPHRRLSQYPYIHICTTHRIPNSKYPPHLFFSSPCSSLLSALYSNLISSSLLSFIFPSLLSLLFFVFPGSSSPLVRYLFPFLRSEGQRYSHIFPFL